MNPQVTINQLGGRGLSGALTYAGVSRLSFDPASNKLALKVNGPRGYSTFISVELTPKDSYTLRLIRKRLYIVEVIETIEDIYCEELQETFEKMYDDHMAVYAAGFIPVRS